MQIIKKVERATPLFLSAVGAQQGWAGLLIEAAAYHHHWCHFSDGAQDLNGGVVDKGAVIRRKKLNHSAKEGMNRVMYEPLSSTASEHMSIACFSHRTNLTLRFDLLEVERDVFLLVRLDTVSWIGRKAQHHNFPNITNKYVQELTTSRTACSLIVQGKPDSRAESIVME